VKVKCWAPSSQGREVSIYFKLRPVLAGDALYREWRSLNGKGTQALVEGGGGGTEANE